MGIGKDYLVTLGHPDRLDRGRNRWGRATDFLERVHQHGLLAHAWTFKNEWTNLYWENGQDPYSEMEEFLQLGLDGFFTDFPLTARYSTGSKSSKFSTLSFQEISALQRIALLPR